MLAVFHRRIAIGIVSALRQYSGLDYTVTFLAFLFFALPVFFIGVILKDLLAIRFNNFLQAGAAFSWASIIIFSLVMGLIGYSVVPGELRRRLAVGADRSSWCPSRRCTTSPSRTGCSTRASASW